ncbi:MAG: ABC transporter permease [Robiginitomaculum sp.]|nr:ABC transporter permease [Robiginitomaculum sp.]
MSGTITTIPLQFLALSLLPVCVVLWIQFRWGLAWKEGVYGVSRMLAQLLVIGYFLLYIFGANNIWILLAVLGVMVLAASWIALRTVKQKRRALFGAVLVAVLLGGVSVLILITQGVLRLSPWYRADIMVPLAGMVFAGSMNAISLAAERYYEERGRNVPIEQARASAFRTAMIPITNALFAVGLVSLPGMMTGQILSGVDPLIAVRYQIMVMTMLYGSAGLSAAVFLVLVSREGSNSTYKRP